MGNGTESGMESGAEAAQAPSALATADAAAQAADGDALPRTAPALRQAVQELLKTGVLEQAVKPRLFGLLAAQSRQVEAILEPLDLRLRVDELRGLAFVAVAQGHPGEGGDDGAADDLDDDWSHPLVRRQRLTLEQSLLLAILRREFLQQEQETGIGAAVRLPVDQLLPQLEIYLGATGSDMQDRRRLGQLLEGLRGHGVVSEVDAQECITIRPVIVHLANPENLQALLACLRAMTAGEGGESSSGNGRDDDAQGPA
ncbi:DUF4194 domain-containing protein [Vandammella animalimorsus]|uniref:DUF4194 domain-containing protein n=2 Tax=Vandammella animalimorsus TaxID=2029117 RepID=A0A3M6R9Z2_9BURK|nr:DUF4194 domain-containing protein [Vandammella animalimorsus]